MFFESANPFGFDPKSQLVPTCREALDSVRSFLLMRNTENSKGTRRRQSKLQIISD